MTLRTAIRQSRLLTFGLLLVGAWTALQVLRIVEGTDSLVSLGTPVLSPGTATGRVGAAGIMGVLVLLAFLGLLVVLWGEIGEVEPGPERFPPEE